MPIFFQHDIDEHTKVGIWKIEEPEEFFLKKAIPQRLVSHPHKKLQHLAGRFLLDYLYPGFPVELILVADTRKPFLEDEKYHFSIAHCGNYAAAVVSRINRVGVDTELLNDKIHRIRDKFVSVAEEVLLGRQIADMKPGNDLPFAPETILLDTRLLTMIWSVKEAAFKWFGLGGVDFKKHMQVNSIIPDGDNGFNIILTFQKKEAFFLNLRTVFFNDQLCLSYVVT